MAGAQGAAGQGGRGASTEGCALPQRRKPPSGQPEEAVRGHSGILRPHYKRRCRRRDQRPAEGAEEQRSRGGPRGDGELGENGGLTRSALIGLSVTKVHTLVRI